MYATFLVKNIVLGPKIGLRKKCCKIVTTTVGNFHPALTHSYPGRLDDIWKYSLLAYGAKFGPKKGSRVLL